ncbi:hypothetical protein GCM10009549_48120 [Streptomyces thermoalcalitolerans]|uniref:Uncharacterized protein n=1 Tax=Streptomyces thermoalcalitolerans TaxID=65605 RepID=A0ABN1PD48_9ACTN
MSPAGRVASTAARHSRSRRSRPPVDATGGARARVHAKGPSFPQDSQDFQGSQAGRTTWWTDDSPSWGIGSWQT